MVDKQNEGKAFLATYIKGEGTIATWSVVGNALALVNSFLILTYLDLFQYGLFLLLFSFYGFVSGIFLQPLQDVIVNDISRQAGSGHEADAKKLYWEMARFRIGMSLTLMAALFIGAEFVALWYHQDIANLLRLLAFLFPIDTAYVMMRTLFEVRLRFDLTSSRPVVLKAIKIALVLLTVFFGHLSVFSLLVITILSAMLTTVLFAKEFITLYRSWSAVPASPGRFLWPLFKTYGKWPLVGQVVSESIGNIRPWLIKAFTNTEAVALFSVAESLYGMTKRVVPTQTLTTLLPRQIKDKEKMRRVFVQGTKYVVLGGIVAGILGFFAVPTGLRLFFPQYEASILVYWVLLLTLPFSGFRQIGVLYLLVYRRQRFLFFTNILKSTLRLVIPLMLLPTFGLVGMSIERVIVTALLAFLAYGHVIKRDVGAVSWREFATWTADDRAFARRAARAARTIATDFFSSLRFRRSSA